MVPPTIALQVGNRLEMDTSRKPKKVENGYQPETKTAKPETKIPTLFPTFRANIRVF
jgi:hypothetical protein